jgi:hypothetical protein
VQQTILDEWWKPAFARYLIPKQTGLRLELERYLRYYNTERAHTGPGRCQRFARNCATRNLTPPDDPTLGSTAHLRVCVVTRGAVR